jgi:phosphoglucosamine mutase
LGEKGRVLVRYSGTQDLCRVMVEGANREEIDAYGYRIADCIKEAIG